MQGSGMAVRGTWSDFLNVVVRRRRFVTGPCKAAQEDQYLSSPLPTPPPFPRIRECLDANDSPMRPVTDKEKGNRVTNGKRSAHRRKILRNIYRERTPCTLHPTQILSMDHRLSKDRGNHIAAHLSPYPP